jgi:hypothetical protein
MTLPLCAWNVKGKCIKELPYKHIYCDCEQDRKSCKNYASCHEYTVIWTQSGKPIK